MNSKLFFFTCLCIYTAYAYGPVFVLSNNEKQELYVNGRTNTTDLEAIVGIDKSLLVYILYNATESVVNDVETYTKKYDNCIVLPHFTESLDGDYVKVVRNTKELDGIIVDNKTVVLQYFLGEDLKPTEDNIVTDEERKGVPMTPAVLVALLTVFTLGLALYFTVACIDQIQTPTTYTDKVLAVGKEF